MLLMCVLEALMNADVEIPEYSKGLYSLTPGKISAYSEKRLVYRTHLTRSRYDFMPTELLVGAVKKWVNGPDC